jgi:hypothetical protein
MLSSTLNFDRRLLLNASTSLFVQSNFEFPNKASGLVYRHPSPLLHSFFLVTDSVLWRQAKSGGGSSSSSSSGASTKSADDIFLDAKPD